VQSLGNGKKLNVTHMNIRLLLVAALCWPILAMPDNFPSISTEIPGVQLWKLHTDGKEFPEEHFEGNDNEFIRYCDGTRSVYVSSLDSPVRCTSQATGQGTYRIYLQTTDRRLSGLAVVSKRPLPSRVKSLPITTEESDRLGKAEKAPAMAFANEAKHYYLETYADTSVAEYVEKLREIKTEATYRKNSGARFKIHSPNGFIYISAVGLTPDPIGWNIKNVVFREIDGRLQVIGAFEGCVKGFRDLDGDGMPEVLTTTCENNEGISDDFWSLTPPVRRVVTH
jgi:hypothetical protein